MPIFILSGIRNGMGVSTKNSEEPKGLGKRARSPGD
jgi:hypothetical protein